MKRDERFLNRAMGVAMTSTCRWKHGAVITKGSKILAWSPNLFRNDSTVDYEGASFHAEDAALRELCRVTGQTYRRGDFRGYTAYVARVNRLGEPRLSRPCKGCWTLLLEQGINEVFYTNEFGGISHEVIE